MTAISTWSTTAASNNSASPDGWPENMAPSGVNDSAREMMAQIRTFYEGLEWRDWGHTITYVGATQFKISGTDVSSVYPVGRRVHANGTSTGDIYGTITAVAYSTDTTVTVSWDSGSLSNETLTVELGLSPTNTPWPAQILPTGTVTAYAGSSAPNGWLLCDGSAVSRTTYAALFGVISTTYGTGDGSTTFNLPDATGRAIAGKESSASRLTSGVGGVDGGTLGSAGGSQSHTLTAAEMPAHTHALPSAYTFNTYPYSSAGQLDDGGTQRGMTPGSSLITSTAGSGGAHANVQPTIIMNWIIKT